MPAKRKSLYPGCKTPKQDHAFAAPRKNCAGPPIKNEILDDELSAGAELPPCQGKSLSSLSAESGPQKQLGSQQLLFWTRCGICPCSCKTSRQSRRQWKNEWMKSPPETPPKQLTRMQVCCRLNKHPKLTIYRKNSSQPPSMVSMWIFQRYYLL